MTKGNRILPLCPMIQLISALSELGAGTRGSSLGLEALMFASLKEHPTFFEKRHVIDVPVDNRALFHKPENHRAKYIFDIADMYDRSAQAIQDVMAKGDFPLVISGDHSNGGGTIAGVKAARPDWRWGVIWIDAHADLHSPYTSPSGNLHGMPLATALAEDNMDCLVEMPSEAVIQGWNRLKGKQPRILHSDLRFVAVRDTEFPEDDLMARHNIPNVTVAALRVLGAAEVAQQLVDSLSDCDAIYVSFDVDSMDSSISVGTGTPVTNGLTIEESRELLTALAASNMVQAMEFTEINPLLDDKGNAMGEAAFSLLSSVIPVLESRN